MLVAGDGLGFTALFVFTGTKSSKEAGSPVMGSFPVSCKMSRLTKCVLCSTVQPQSSDGLYVVEVTFPHLDMFLY